MALSSSDRAWFLEQIAKSDPAGEIVEIVTSGVVTKLRYSDKFRSDETLLRAADPEELVRALTVCLLCGPAYGYAPARMYLEQTHSIGRPSASTAQIDLIVFFGEEDGSETVFAMWEMKSPDEYKPLNDPLIEKQLFNTAPLVAPSLIVYSSIKPQVAEIECITIDYSAHKSYARWDAAGRPST